MGFRIGIYIFCDNRFFIFCFCNIVVLLLRLLSMLYNYVERLRECLMRGKLSIRFKIGIGVISEYLDSTCLYFMCLIKKCDILTRVYFRSNFMKLSSAELLLARDILLALTPWSELMKGISASSGRGVPSIDSEDCFLILSFFWNKFYKLFEILPFM